MRDRMTALVLVSAVLVGVFGLLRPRQPWTQGVQENLYWLQKLQWREEFDLVLAGDSRMYRDVSPRELAKDLPGFRIANFGFSGCGFSEPYLEAMGRVLDPKSSRRTMVLGVSPHSLTPNAARNNGFIDKSSIDPFSAWFYRTFPAISTYLKPFSSNEMRMLTGGAPTSFYYNKYHPDGWVASRKDPEDPREAIDEYRRLFEGGNRVTERQEDELIKWVRAWRKQGISVFAFRPPVSVEMLALENEVSGFDQARFTAKFADAGGVWVDVDQTGYHCYDGSHMEEKAALKFSRDLGAALKTRLLPRP